MKRTLALAASAFGLGMAALAPAQAIDARPSGISFRGGLVVALDKDLRDRDKTWAGVGLDYTFTTQYLRNGETYISLDYIFNSSSGNKGSYWPVMLAHRFYNDNGAEEGGRSYLLAGIGAVFFDITSSEVGAGIQLGVGREFGPSIFGEAKLFLSETREGVNANSLGFYLGYRFP